MVILLTISNLILDLTPVEVAEHYQHNIIYRDNLINFIKIQLFTLPQCPNIAIIHKCFEDKTTCKCMF